MIQKIGFIGLGTMGAPMAANLLKAGFSVGVVAHRNRAPVDELVGAGAAEYASAAELAAQVEVLITCVSNDAAVEEVLLGAQGVAEGGRAGLIVVDTSTISPLTSQRLAQTLAAREITLLDAPISGGQGGAQAGTLSIMVGGPQAAFEAVLPALHAMGQNIVHIGANGTALVVKLANNLIVDEVLAVTMVDGQEKFYAAGLKEHKLNQSSGENESSSELDPESVARDFGAELERKLDSAFTADDSLVRIAGRWFPRALLLDVNTGHLNLAEAVLDMAAGEPLRTEALMKDIELPVGVNSNLAEFSLNYALQEDPRFDEVGPAGKVLWCLERLEPEGVRIVPGPLQYVEIEHDRSVLDNQMLALEAQVDDELSEALAPAADEVTISLLYPHWRTGTLPISPRVKRLFPTAYESERVCFTLVDVKTGRKFPAWVVRKHGYVYGLAEWYKSHDLIPGALIRIRNGEQPGEIRIEALTHRSVRDWVRTVIVGTDGGLVFALLKQQISVELNDRMALAVPDPVAVDAAREQTAKSRIPFADLTRNLMRELTKLSPQGHVHVQELYAAINILRRVPPAPLMALLATRPEYAHVGDLHYRLDE